MEFTIIGGGIGGLVTALSFDKLSIPYNLYEKAKSLDAIGAGIWLSPNALQVLEWINPELLQEVLATGNSLKRITLANHKLQPISDSDQSFVHAKFGYTTLAIHRGLLQQILYKYVNQENIKLDKTFKSYHEEKDFLEVQFTDYTSIQTNAIIGADGIHSPLRKQLFPNSTIRYSGQTCWRGISDYSLNEELASSGFTLWGKKVQFGVAKITEDKVYWFAVKLSEPNLQDNPNNVTDVLTKMFNEFDPVVTELINHTPAHKIFRGDLSDLELLDKWYENNICLIGDAAHAMTPDLGQGGAQAIEDAYYLSNFIAKYKTPQLSYPKFFDYRKAKVQKLVKQSRMTSKMAITNRPMEILRNFILKNMPKSMLSKQMLELYKIDKTLFK